MGRKILRRAVSSLPFIVSMNRTLADGSGGDLVTITGERLTGGTVTVGGTSATVTASAADEITFRMPPKGMTTHSVPSFEGGSELLQADGIAANYISTAAYSGWAVIRARSVSTDSTRVDMIIGTATSRRWGVYLRSSGRVEVFGFNGAIDVTASAAFKIGSLNLVQWNYDGTTLKIRVNGGSWQSVSAGNIDTLATFGLLIGRSPLTIDVTIDADIYELAVTDASMGDEVHDEIAGYASHEYLIDCGSIAPNRTFDPSVLSLKGYWQKDSIGAGVWEGSPSAGPSGDRAAYSITPPSIASVSLPGQYPVVVTTGGGTSNALKMAVWSAGNTPGLLADLNPTHAVVSSGLVMSLPDQSGYGFDATAPSTMEPTFSPATPGYDDKPTVYFPNVVELGGDLTPAKILDQNNDIAAEIAGDRVTLFVVGHVGVPWGNKYPIITKAAPAVGAYLDSGPLWNSYANGTYTPFVGDDAYGHFPKVIGYAFQSDDNVRMYLGRRTPAVSTGAAMTGIVSSGFRLGCWQIAQSQWSASGHYARYLVYKGTLTQQRCEEIMTALGRLYGLQVGA